MSKLNWQKNKERQRTNAALIIQRDRKAYLDELAGRNRPKPLSKAEQRAEAEKAFKAGVKTGVKVEKKEAELLKMLSNEKPVSAPIAPPTDETPYIYTRIEEIDIHSKVFKVYSHVLVTPEIATKWLEGNVHNRKLQQYTIAEYTPMMAAKQWKHNAESIKFRNGVLEDGQHRLWACIESNTPFMTVVAVGVEEDSFMTIDRGKTRTASDMLFISGLKESYNTTVAATANLILRYRNNNLFSGMKTNAIDLIELTRKEPEFIEWVARSLKGELATRRFAPAIAAVLYLASKNQPKKVEEFLEQWLTGANLREGSPILALRIRLTNKKPPQIPWERLYLAVSTWNAFVNEQPRHKMSMLRTGVFPRIEGAE